MLRIPVKASRYKMSSSHFTISLENPAPPLRAKLAASVTFIV